MHYNHDNALHYQIVQIEVGKDVIFHIHDLDFKPLCMPIEANWGSNFPHVMVLIIIILYVSIIVIIIRGRHHD